VRSRPTAPGSISRGWRTGWRGSTPTTTTSIRSEEGNGRAGTLLLHTVATLGGRRLDLTALSREEWYAASRDSMPFRRDGRPNHRPFLPLFSRAVTG
jgi:hypothetical protein